MSCDFGYDDGHDCLCLRSNKNFDGRYSPRYTLMSDAAILYALMGYYTWNDKVVNEAVLYDNKLPRVSKRLLERNNLRSQLHCQTANGLVLTSNLSVNFSFWITARCRAASARREHRGRGLTTLRGLQPCSSS